MCLTLLLIGSIFLLMVMQSSRSVLWWMLLNIILDSGYVSWAVVSILFTLSQILVTYSPPAMLFVPPAITTTLGFLGWFWDWVWGITWVRRWHLLPGYKKQLILLRVSRTVLQPSVWPYYFLWSVRRHLGYALVVLEEPVAFWLLFWLFEIGIFLFPVEGSWVEHARCHIPQ